ncbi:unnamed protein product [Polarella glacialis]|uniref:Uncharacterized protein n=1 Tax=Polarella glacialis TaxID=89957 RepID=A0A813JVX2_POLGL|nr:unnamed protein product [Polarella glacialis]
MAAADIEARSPGHAAYDKAAEMLCGCQEQDQLPCDVQDQLVKDLAGTYYWSGDVSRDWAFFVANWHPLLGICLSHPSHPWQKTERLSSFVITSSLTLLPSAFLVKLVNEDLEGGGHMTAMSIFVFVTLPVMLLEVVLYYVSIADMYCKGNCCCDMIGRVGRCFKRCCFCASFLLAFQISTLSLLVMPDVFSHHAQELLKPFLVSKLQSWITWFPLMTFMPCIGFLHSWCIERRQPQHGAESESSGSEDGLALSEQSQPLRG